MTSGKKRVMIIQHYTGLGGSSLASLDLAQAVANAGFEVLLAIPGENSPLERIAKSKGFEILNRCPNTINFTYHSASGGFLRAIIKYLLQKKYTSIWANIIKKNNPSLVILNSGAQSPMIDIVKSLGIPCVCYVRETIRANSIWNRVVRNILSKADCVLFLTKYDLESWNLKSKNQFIAPEVVIFPVLKKREKAEKQKVTILYLGGYSYEKGIQEMLKAFSIISSPNVELYVLGDEYKAYNDMSLIKKLVYCKQIVAIKESNKIISVVNSNSERIHVMGLQNNVADWYKRSDIVVFPVKKVHQARPAYEAGYFSLPIVVPNYDNFRDNIRDGYNGLLYEKGNYQDLAKKLEVLIDDSGYREMLGKNNYAVTMRNHSMEQITECMEKALKLLI